MALVKKMLAALSAVLTALALPLSEGADTVVPGKYIVKLKAGVQIQDHLLWASDVHARSSRRRDTDTGISHSYSITQGFNAYAGAFDDATIEQIRNSDEVALVEPDTIWHLLQAPEPASPSAPSSLTTQTNATWGLSRISHRNITTTNNPTTTNTTTTADYDYIYDPRGTGTDSGTYYYAYVVDTGLRTTHAEFGGRAALAYNAVAGAGPDDNVGHGTHVAGTIGARTYGVAKWARLLSVKVLDSELGFATQVMDGFAWAVNNITAEGRQASSVISISIGGSYSQTFNDIIQAARDAGVTTVAAAGNYGEPASLSSPASAPAALTVGALAADDSRPAWSDYGTAVDLFAPGVDVLSTWAGGDGDDEDDRDHATNTLSGTSMAAPHVAGLVLYLKSIAAAEAAAAEGEVEGEGENGKKQQLDAPDDVAARVVALATKGVVRGAGAGSPNLVAYNGNGA